MNQSGYASAIDAVRRLYEAARKLPLEQSLGLSSAELASALQEVDADLEQLQAQEDALRWSEQRLTKATEDNQLHYLRFQELFELSPDGCLLTDTRGVIRHASRTAASLLRCRKEFLLEKPLAFFMAGSTKEFYTYLEQLGREGSPGRYWEVCLKPLKGEPVHVELSVAAFRNGDNRPIGYLWALRDITARKRAEQTLLVEKEFANTLIENAHVIILVLDSQGRIIRSNQFLHALSGFEPAELLHQDWCERFLPESDRPAARTLLVNAWNGEKSKGETFGLVTRGGVLRMVAWSAQRLAFEHPTGAILLLVGHDVTEAQEAQKQALTMERLAAIGHAVTMLTHESRNALQRIQVCLEILRVRLKDQPADLEFLARIQRAQNDLLRLYEEVRAYGAPIQVVRDRCDLAAVWREAWEQVTSLFPGKQAMLCEDTGGVDLWCQADRFRLIQVFRNLLENAFAACPGPARITISCQDTLLARQPALQIALQDNGVGLNPEQKRHIFDPFYTTKARGTGLGTSIARRIVEAHGGQIAVGESTQPGTEIVITLPRHSG